MSRFVSTAISTSGQYFKTCRYCGRTWWMDGGRAVGFVIAGAGVHIDSCRDRSPAERRTQNIKDERRWKKNPPQASRIVNEPGHPGLSDDIQSTTADRAAQEAEDGN